MSDGAETPQDADDGGGLSSRLRDARDHAAQTRAVVSNADARTEDAIHAIMKSKATRTRLTY